MMMMMVVVVFRALFTHQLFIEDLKHFRPSTVGCETSWVNYSAVIFKVLRVQYAHIEESIYNQLILKKTRILIYSFHGIFLLWIPLSFNFIFSASHWGRAIRQFPDSYKRPFLQSLLRTNPSHANLYQLHILLHLHFILSCFHCSLD